MLSEGDNAMMVKQVKISKGLGIVKQGTPVKDIPPETNGPEHDSIYLKGFFKTE